MKKLFAIFAITGALVACNNDSESTEGTSDTAAIMDTTTTTMDTTTIMDTTGGVIDTTATADTAK
jgi:hypothetical protein